MFEITTLAFILIAALTAMLLTPAWALTANRQLDRYIDEELAEHPIKGSVKLFNGAIVGRDATTGLARPLVAGDAVLGISHGEYDNSAGADGALKCRVFARGRFKVPLSAVQTNVGAVIYATDDATFSLVSNNSPVGKLQELSDAGYVILQLHTESMTDTVVGLKDSIVTHTEADSPVALTAADSGKVYNNLGAGDTVHYDLPTAPTEGLKFTFVALAAQAIQIDPGDNDAIFVNGAKQTDGKFISFDAINEQVVLLSNSDGDWIAIDVAGTITVES